MSRVGYLAALGGGAGPVAAPSLRPPRRLFPHEPAPGDAPPQAEQRTIDAPPPELPVARARPASVTPPARAAEPEPAAEPAPLPLKPGERVPPDAGRLTVPAGRVTSAAPPGTHEPVHAPGSPQAGTIEPPGRALPAADTAIAREPLRTQPRPAARAHEAPPSPRRDTPVQEPTRELALAAAEPHRPPVQLEPPRSRPEPALLQPRTPTPPLRTPDTGVPQLHIGTIEVTVVPPPPPAPAPPQPAATRPVSTVAWRSGGTGRWFGLAQR